MARAGAVLNLVYVAREKPQSGRAPPLQIFHTLRGICLTGSGVRYVTPWKESLVREQFKTLTSHDVTANLQIVSLGSGPSIPMLQHNWTTLWSASFMKRMRQYLAELNWAEKNVVVYTRNRNVVSDLCGDDLPPMVFECHEFRSRSAAEIRNLAPDAPEVEEIREEERRALSRVAALAPLTQCLADEYRASFPDFDRPIHVVPDGVDPTLFEIPPHERKPVPGRFIYVGSIIPWKGLNVALSALARVPDAELHICGGKRDSHEFNELVSLATELKVVERIFMHGTIPQAKLPPLLASAIAGILPLDGKFAIAARYTSPLKLFEYLCAGLPVLATDLPSLREVMQHEREGLLFPDGNAEALARAMQRLMDDPNLTAKLSAAARETAKKYTWEKRAERIWACCREVLENKLRQQIP